MLITTPAIVLNSVKYGDTSLIVHLYTELAGLQSYLLKGIRSSRNRNMKTAHFLPANQLEIVATHKAKGTLENIREIRLMYPYSTLHTHWVKSAQVMYLSELLSQVLREEEENKALFSFLTGAFRALDLHQSAPDFHLIFMLELAGYLGFAPDREGLDLPFFNLGEGHFDEVRLPGALEGQLLEDFKWLLQQDLTQSPVSRLSADRRNDLLKVLQEYFRLHLHEFRTPRSAEVLRTVFHPNQPFQ